jgi:hypothetical protein
VIRQRAPVFIFLELVNCLLCEQVILFSCVFCDDSTRHAGGVAYFVSVISRKQWSFYFYFSNFFYQISLSLAVAVIGFFFACEAVRSRVYFVYVFFSFV